jgi:hypothetical protein
MGDLSGTPGTSHETTASSTSNSPLASTKTFK